MNNLYQSNPTLGKLYAIYLEIFSRQTAPTATNLALVCLSMLFFNACPSIRFAYEHCIKFLTTKSLKTFYYMFSRAEVLRDRWWRWLILKIISLIPKHLSHLPIILICDDTIISKHGRFFDFVGKLFDHSKKTENKYVNGHCFVTVMISIPVPFPGGGYFYLPFPLVHRMWRGAKGNQKVRKRQKADVTNPKATGSDQTATEGDPKVAESSQTTAEGNLKATESGQATAEGNLKATESGQATAEGNLKATESGQATAATQEKKEETKLIIAKDYLVAAIGEIRKAGVTAKICVLCDSWYPKGPMLSLVNLPNVEMICAARIDTFMAEVPESKPKKGRGRPRKYGNRLHSSDIDATPVKGTDYSVGTRTVMTKLFDKSVQAFVTEKKGNRRLYLCSNPSLFSDIAPGLHIEGDAAKFVEERSELLPLALYRNRWEIETCFYQLKTFWGMCDYRLLTIDGIENLVNLHLLNYSLTTLLPMVDKDFAPLAGLSLQERRYTLGALLNRLLIIERLCPDDQEDKKTLPLREICKQMILGEGLSA